MLQAICVTEKQERRDAAVLPVEKGKRKNMSQVALSSICHLRQIPCLAPPNCFVLPVSLLYDHDFISHVLLKNLSASSPGYLSIQNLAFEFQISQPSTLPKITVPVPSTSKPHIITQNIQPYRYHGHSTHDLGQSSNIKLSIRRTST